MFIYYILNEGIRAALAPVRMTTLGYTGSDGNAAASTYLLIPIQKRIQDLMFMGSCNDLE